MTDAHRAGEGAGDGAEDVVRLDVLGPGDGPRLRAVLLRSLEVDPDSFWTTLEEERAKAPSATDHRVADPAGRCLVAVVAGADVGVACLRVSHDGDSHELTSVWVDPAVRGRGVARTLAGALVEHARAGQVQRLTLWHASANTAAAALYASLGFRPTGRSGAFPAPRHIPEHELELHLRR